ncbi:enoyl-CoA hydratase/isomerase family protein [Ramlibacter sp.]|uniref:enoyl-CoA hydratase/isomerase family protein n=1 Tax=Ramlibacter sp. TaxID=1917967 RepID=UPI003D0F98B9
MSQSFPPLLERHGNIAVVTLRRPAQANKLQQEDVELLHDFWRAIRQDESVRAVVLTAQGRHFSAGYDLGAILRTDRVPEADNGENAFGSMVDALEQLPQVTVCALNGGVYGGATDLALACDFRIAVRSCEMFMPAARLGLHYHLGGLRRFVSRLGLDTAKRLFLLADKLPAPEMHAIGYLQRIVEPDDLLPQAMDIAWKAAAMAPLASRGMKATLNAIAADNVDLAEVRRSEVRAMHSKDLQEGVTAWHEKRVPVFHGN